MIDFHFDFASLYGYFMSEKIDALAARHGRTVTWRPMISFAVPRALGLCGPLENAVKREYMLADVERSARFPGIACQFPSKFPITTPCAAAWHTAGPDAGDGQTVHQSTIYPGYGGSSGPLRRRGWRMSASRSSRKNWGRSCAGCLRNGGPLHAVSPASRGRKFSPRLYRFGSPPRRVRRCLRCLRCLRFVSWLGAGLRDRLCHLGKGIAAKCLDLQGLGSGNTGHLRVAAVSVLVPTRVNRGLCQRGQRQHSVNPKRLYYGRGAACRGKYLQWLELPI